MDVIATNLLAVRERMAAACRRAGREADEVRLVAVTKTVGPEALAALRAAGVADFGENRVEHLEIMADAQPEARFHFIGRVQSRQFKRIVPRCRALHSLHERSHVTKLARACRQAGRRLEVFCQVNTGNDPAKAGLPAGDLPGVLDDLIAAADVLNPVGLMVMAPWITDPDELRACFAACRELARRHGLPRLSMGMSNDFELAIEEGATDIRIGSVLFAGHDHA